MKNNNREINFYIQGWRWAARVLLIAWSTSASLGSPLAVVPGPAQVVKYGPVAMLLVLGNKLDPHAPLRKVLSEEETAPPFFGDKLTVDPNVLTPATTPPPPPTPASGENYMPPPAAEEPPTLYEENYMPPLSTIPPPPATVPPPPATVPPPISMVYARVWT